MTKQLGRFLIFLALAISLLTSISSASALGSNPILERPPSTFSLSNAELGLVGPFSFGITRDDLFNWSGNAQYTQKFNEMFAASAVIELGSDLQRYNGTLGFRLFDNALLKVTAERLNQVLPFNFTSGSVNQRMAQTAYGAQYQYTFKNAFIRDVNLGGYYSNTPNKSLDSILFLHDRGLATNDRNIAGGVSNGFNIGTDIALTSSTMIAAHLNYDNLRYKTIYGTSTEDSKGIGGSLGIDQLLGKHVKLFVTGSMREIYDTYKAGISWLLSPTFPKIGIEISLAGEHLTTHDETPNSTTIGLQFSFKPYVDVKNLTYQLSSPSCIEDIGIFTSIPAVYMERVLATSDEKIREPSSLVIMITPASQTVDIGGTPQVLTATPGGGSGSYTSYQWYRDGVLDNTQIISTYTIPTADTNASGINIHSYRATVTDSLSTVSPQSNSSTLSVNPALTVSISPTSQTVDIGGTPQVLTATPGGGSGSYTSYQWYRDGVLDNSQTGSTYTIPTADTNASGANVHSYRATVTDSLSTVSPPSNDSTLNVNPPLTVTILPTIQTIPPVLPVGFSLLPLTATPSGGSGSYTYLWYREGSPTSETGSTYTIPTDDRTNNTAVDIVYHYYVIVMDSLSSVATSNTSQLIVQGTGGVIIIIPPP